MGKKKLSEMTLEELWQLFPIILSEHKAEWDEWYEEERESLTAVVPSYVGIHHIGSTAIDHIWAKPIVDIMLVVPMSESLHEIADMLAKHGYTCMYEKETQACFNKGYTENGFAEKVFHIHVRFEGDTDEILFRDYMNKHPQAAKEYQELKLSLWKKYEHDRDGYTEAKTEFIKGYMQKAYLEECQA